MSERYRIVRSLGSGGMAEVFLAYARGAEGFEKPVVIKRLHPHLSRHESVARMFLSEARLSMHLHHQNVVQVMDVGQGPEGLYLVMELVNGWDLSVLLGHAKRAGYPPEHLVAYLAAQVAAGLAHAFRKVHAGKKVLQAHRDISPSNILVTAEGEVKVADFGIARVEGAQLTEPGSFKGKVPFAAPEVVRGVPATSASDQFSLGVVLYRLLGQGHPYGYTENLVQYAELLARAGAPRVDFASPDFRKILLRLLALRPEDRFPSWDAAAQELGVYLAHAGAPANATELARWLATLDLPPPPLDVPESAGDAPRGSFGTSSVASEFELESEWMGGGPALDASGRLSGSGRGAPATPAPSLRAATPAPEDEAPLELAHDPREPVVNALPVESPDRAAALAPSSGAASLPAEGFTPLPGRYDARPKRRLFPLFLAGFVLLIAAAAGFVLWRGGVPRGLLPPNLTLPRGMEQELAVITIYSAPSGATVFLDGRAVGETPFAKENDYARGAEVKVRLEHPGYRPWTGVFVGGAPVALEAKLRPR